MAESSFTCPVCGATSYNPNDVAEGYCGRCHDFTRKRLPPFRDGTLHVCADLCSTCVFRPGNLMHLQPGYVRELVADNLQAESALVCHKTLPYGDHPEVGEALCRGFYDGPWRDTPARRLAEALGIVTEVTLP